VYKGNSILRNGCKQEETILIITQENLIAQIAGREEISPVTVRRIFKSAEDIIFNHLSSTTSSEHTVIKVLDGLSLECSLLPERKIHTYDTIVCKERLWTKPKITRYYNRKLNGYFK
jgi:hypothetical protein